MMTAPQITVIDYYMGRDQTYARLLTPDLRANAAQTVERVNLLLQRVQGVGWDINPRTRTIVSSGWRPPEINAGTKGAALRSKHMLCRAVDLYDPDGELDEWCISPEGLRAMEDVGLWLEHPAATKGWCHLQTLPPGSGRRVFYP